MKKYISPVAKTIIIDAEATLLAGSGSDPVLKMKRYSDGEYASEDYGALSNSRNSAIWDE